MGDKPELWCLVFVPACLKVVRLTTIHASSASVRKEELLWRLCAGAASLAADEGQALWQDCTCALNSAGGGPEE